MASLNLVHLIGNLGKDPEIRETQGGTKVCNFTLATSESYKDGNGDKVENTEWHNIVAWKSLADVIGKYAHKGDKLFVSGKIATRKWEDKEGTMRYTTEIQAKEVIFLTPKSESQPVAHEDYPRPKASAQNSRTQDEPTNDFPF